MNNKLDKNVKLINDRLDAGLALLRKYYEVEEQPVDAVLANPVIGGRPHHARRFDIKGVGNLLAMTVTEAEQNQLSSFVIMPYFKNLPLFSTDYVYSGEKRFFLLEIYDLSVVHDSIFDAGIESFRAFGAEMTDMQDFPTRPSWYDDIRPVCHAKAPDESQDELAIQHFLAFLKLFVDMEQASPLLGADDLKTKWQKNREYADRLIDEGGVSTDLFTEALGAENTRRFFHEVFFGADCYRPLSLEGIDSFLSYVDAEGKTNRDKISADQHIIRRVATTDKSKSYEDSDSSAQTDDYPAGVVLQNGSLIGFGIHIFNEDIYPLQSFEIYLRKCGLCGPLDLSNQKDLLFVDIYHNNVDAIDVSGDRSLRILGIQDNAISALDVRDLEACQGIDAGKNKLSSLDVSHNKELVELYINDNEFTEIDLSACPKLKYFYCHNNSITELDTTANQLLRHLNATGNPMRSIKALAPQREEQLPLQLTAEGEGCVGLRFNPVYNAQWKETGKWQQSYYAYPAEGHEFEGWYDEAGEKVSGEAEWFDDYGTSRVLTARFAKE
ncbi:MAG: hypothetical protein IJJ06_07285 [Mogibacterium sp.]|nr:hypothetical protein [Mogibacterium sp.]